MNRFNSSRSLYTGLAGLVLIWAPALSHATTRNVPATYPNIQAAINASANGDTVLISNGVYSGPGNVGLDPGGKAITIKSAGGPGSCTIDGGSANQIFLIQSGETARTVISGFTLEHGSGFNGGALYISNSSPTLSNCVFENNFAIYGGGCYATVTSTNTPTFSNCTFLHNTAGDGGEQSWGGGLMLVGGAGAIKNCSFVSNVARIPAGWISDGGGLALQSDKTKVTNCAFNLMVRSFFRRYPEFDAGYSVAMSGLTTSELVLWRYCLVPYFGLCSSLARFCLLCGNEWRKTLV